mmetsp:Transcript_14054/g.42413  ORF Transcript_14054/g.42413 Transcript_14054/m.42413 type:complete len:628 (+) Transcript_14054:269-2152(+)
MRPRWCLALGLIACLAGQTTSRQLQDTDLPLSELVWARESSGLFLGSPSIVALPNNSYLASHDEFGPGGVAKRVHVFRSDDRGASWREIALVNNQYWSTLFLHTDGAAYLLGTTADGFAAGSGIAISRSTDGGFTWTNKVLVPPPAVGVGSYATGAAPVLVANGRLWRAIELWAAPRAWPQNFQAALLSADMAADLLDPASWTLTPTLPFQMSWLANTTPAVPVSGFLEGNAVQGLDGTVKVLMRMPLINQPKSFIDLNHACLLNFVLLPSNARRMALNSSDGGSFHLSSAARVDATRSRPTRRRPIRKLRPTKKRPTRKRPAATKLKPTRAKPTRAKPTRPKPTRRITLAATSMPTMQPTLMPTQQPTQQPTIKPTMKASTSGAGSLDLDRIVDMPGGGNRFTVRKDAVTELYVSLANPQTAGAAGFDQRNVLELIVSKDLIDWQRAVRVLSDDTGFTWPDSLRYTGFHYVDWQFGAGDESNDLIAVIRTSYRGAVNFHNSNRVTFTRVPAWRQLVAQATSAGANATGTPPVTLLNPGRFLPSGGAGRRESLPLPPPVARQCAACPTGGECDTSTCRVAAAVQQTAQQQADAAREQLADNSAVFHWGSSCCALAGPCTRCGAATAS